MNLYQMVLLYVKSAQDFDRDFSVKNMSNNNAEFLYFGKNETLSHLKTGTVQKGLSQEMA